ncbi:alpha/beta hydrolase [Streptomyces sp. NPDC059215]|uniref:alpha/beta hydrolase n=1 Tax=Streptomyces sp. NPDC059215 TaxID=3346772 RepID=UPI0036AB6910
MTTNPPPFDAELAAALATTGLTSIVTGITLDTLAAERDALLENVPTVAQLAEDGRFHVEEMTAPGPEGAPDVSLLVIRPKTLKGSRPIIYHAHGGGLMMGNNRYGIDPVLEWAAELDLVVVSVEYRLAPEHPFPAGTEDAYAGLVWTAQHAQELSGDPRRIILAGGSAGGTIAAALALLARDRGEVGVLGQLLMYPMLDNRNETVSSHQMLGLGIWDRVSTQTGWSAWLGNTAADSDVSPYAVPGRAQDLSGLAPTFLEVGSAETFRDEVVAFAGRLWEASGDAELHVWPGAFHAFDFLSPQALVSQRSTAARLQWLRRLLGE